MLDIPGLELEEPKKQKAWRHVPSFLNSDEADKLYEHLERMTFSPHPTDGPGAFYKTLGRSYSGRGTNFEPVEDVAMSQGWRNFAERVGRESQSPINYIQMHRFSSEVPVRPHFDPGGMIVPMLTVGQERTFRVGGKFTDNRCYPGSKSYLTQLQRGLELHEPAEEVLMKHGDLLVFIGGNVIHSMRPAADDVQFNPNGRDWRFSIIFRWTTEAMRQFGPGKKATAAGHKEQYAEALAAWRKR
jgi:hypothetical protein